jgi:ParB family chromosome partitioning protein
VPLVAITPNRHQPRAHFDEESLVTLAASVREVGVIQPVLLRATGDETYELIAGERRWRAAKRAGLTTIPALIRDADELGSVEQALVENLHREDLSPLEEAGAYQQLIEDFGLTHDELAARVGKSRVAITNTLRLFQLPPTIQKLIAERRLSAGHARALLGTPDRSFQEALAKRTVDEGLSVRAVEEAVRARQGSPDRAARARSLAFAPLGCSSSKSCFPSGSIPGSRSIWAPVEARSSSSSPRSKTSSGSIDGWPPDSLPTSRCPTLNLTMRLSIHKVEHSLCGTA